MQLRRVGSDRHEERRACVQRPLPASSALATRTHAPQRGPQPPALPAGPTCSMTMRDGSSSRRLSLAARTPKKSGARGPTALPCACSAATSAEVGVKEYPTGTHFRASALAPGGGGGPAGTGPREARRKLQGRCGTRLRAPAGSTDGRRAGWREASRRAREARAMPATAVWQVGERPSAMQCSTPEPHPRTRPASPTPTLGPARGAVRRMQAT